MMFEGIEPGASVQVKVVKSPTTVAARKTLARLLSKSPAARAEQKRLEKIRKDRYHPTMRGGRLYGGRMPKIHARRGELGESGTLTATVDVLTDLNSVRRFVEVTPA